jgi:hypothetical protein
MDGLQVKYSELLSLAVTQLFYENKVCSKYSTTPVPDIVFMPSAETQELMKRLGLIFRANDSTGGFTVMARTNGILAPGTDELLRFPPKKGDKLSFFALLRNPAMMNFNELPVTTDQNKLFYFSNEVTDLLALRTNLHLSKLAAGVSIADDMMKKSGEIYRFHHSAAVGAGAAKVKHLLTGVEIVPVSVVNNGAQSDLIFDLTALPSGKCELMISAVKTDEFYYTGLNAPRPLLGVVELNLSPLVLNSKYRITEADKTIQAAKPLFTLTFNNRMATWRYTIKLQPSSPLYIELAALAAPAKAAFLSNLKITTNDPAVKFTQQPGATDTTIVFHSDTTLAFREKYIAAPGVRPLSITLKKNTGLPGEAVVKTDMPYPSTSSLDAVNDPIIYSDIFLTL